MTQGLDNIWRAEARTEETNQYYLVGVLISNNYATGIGIKLVTTRF